MIRKIVHYQPTPRAAMAVSIAIGVITLSGPALAKPVVTVAKKASSIVTGKQIKAGTISSRQIKDGSLKPEDLSSETLELLRPQHVAQSVSTGLAGPVGPKGDAGADGSTGPVGLRGAVGAEGRQGAPGEQGPGGPQGPQGLTGTVRGYEVVSGGSASDSDNDKSAIAGCPQGKSLISVNGYVMTVNAADRAKINYLGETVFIGAAARAVESEPVDGNWSVHIQVVCGITD